MYEKLCEKLKEMSTLSGISGLLGYVNHAMCLTTFVCEVPLLYLYVKHASLLDANG